MSLTLRPSSQRGHAHHGWLDARHSFSFAHYHDPAHMGFRSLRVINEDTVHADGGFPTHGHKDMEIVTYIVRGSLAHKDSTGGEGVLHRGDVQSMSAGTGVRHSEFNASSEEDLHLLQIWLVPEREGIVPAYRQRHVTDAAKKNILHLVAAGGGEGEVLPLHQDARIYASLLDKDATVTHHVGYGRGVWIQLIEGKIRIRDQSLTAGDGIAIENVSEITIIAEENAEFLLFDLA